MVAAELEAGNVWVCRLSAQQHWRVAWSPLAAVMEV